MRCARLRRARGRDARAPGANLRCARPCRGGLVGKPRRAISRFRHQDAQPPPSPRVGEGGRGDEGAHAHRNARASLPGTLPLMRCARLRRARGRDYINDCADAERVAPPARTQAGLYQRPCRRRASGASGAHAGGTPAHPAQTSGARASGAHAGGTPAHPAQTSGTRALAGAGLLASPSVPSPVLGIRTPNLPLLPVWEKGARGDKGQKCGEDSGMLANRSSGYPARSHRRGAPSGDKCLQMPALIV